MNMSAIHQTAQKKHAGRTKSTTANTPTARFLALIRSSAIGVGCSLGVALLLLLLSASLLVGMTDPTTWTYPASLTILYLTALLCGLLTKQLSAESSWLCGLTAGTLLLLGCLSIGCFFPAEEIHSPAMLFGKLPTLLLPFAGTYLVRKKSRKHARRRR